MPITILRQKIAAIKKFDIVAETIKIINDNGFYIAGLLRLQLQEGKDGDGKNVTVFGRDYYSDATIQDKRYNGSGLGKQTEWITNYMSGHFYSSLKVKTQGTLFSIESDLPYFKDILERSGSVIMELNKQHLQEFTEEILIPTLQQRLKVYGL